MNKMKKKMHASAGFTLIELAIVMVLISILSLVLLPAMIEFPKLFRTIEIDQEMAREGRDVMQWMGRDIRQAGSIDIDSAGKITISGDSGKVVWDNSEQIIKRVEYGSGDKINSTMVLAGKSAFLTLSGQDLGKVQVQLTMKREIMDLDRTYTMSGVYSVRGR